MTHPCPHCWTPAAQRLAAENAARVAHEVAQAHVQRELSDAQARLASAHVALALGRRRTAIVVSALRRSQDAALLARLLAGPTDAEMKQRCTQAKKV